ncbi:F-box only protein 13-like [Cucurbita maxima]|uniref:F-box only protein 13-like n=1 Tax=Cucurbita maxima TaxID=3661 RepID=A0A6J1IYN3_CUCMA|nr:F-box only protein 13-like [Cucurbita maxima]XP_022981151.1 F-box only protein 13-like [Cucurbita maxima]
MELGDAYGDLGVGMTRKRKRDDGGNLLSNFSLDDLNQDILERVLSRLPTSAFFRLSSVCKRWKSVAASSSFKYACSDVSVRDPWFFMVDSHLDRSIVFDSTEKSWKKLNYPHVLQSRHHNLMPVAASGGLICFRNSSGNFIVSNPLTGSCSELPPVELDQKNQYLHAIVMSSDRDGCKGSYKLILVHGQLPKLRFKVYRSTVGCWDDNVTLSRKVDDSIEFNFNDDTVVYFLSRTGNVVSTNMQRSPSKQYSSVIVNKNGEDLIYFISSSGTIMACNLNKRCFVEYPRLLPVFSEYSIDVVECRGEMLVVMLSEFLETASLRVWRYDEDARTWHQIAALPPAMSHEWYGKKIDINCVGAGDQILICMNSNELYTYLLCDLVKNQWTELPKCNMNGEAVEFMSAFSFEPRIEACV